MSGLTRRLSFGDATSSRAAGASDQPGQPMTTIQPATCDKDKQPTQLQLATGAPGTRKRLVSKVGDYMFKSIPAHAHASFGSPSLSYNPHLSSSLLTTDTYSPSSSTLFFAMPRTDNFQGLPAPFFPADTYYFAGSTNPGAVNRSKQSRPRSSISSDSAPSQTSTSKDGNGRSTSLARAQSTSCSRRPSPGTWDKKRPSTAAPSVNYPSVAGLRTGDPHPASSTAGTTSDMELPAIAAEVIANQGTHNPESTISVPSIMPRFATKGDKRHHPYPSSKAPYPRSYDSTAIDHDTSTHIFFTNLCKSVTFHEFATPPTSVLDLGCGNGVWILDAAKAWPNSNFVGLDLMPLQPNLSLVAPQLQDRIQWRIANFLEPLPFEENEFDFVHIRRIARGVPENKWPLVLEEVSRVLKPDGSLEVVEEDLIFPGGQEPCTCHYPPDAAPPEDTTTTTSHLNAGSSSHGHERHERERHENGPESNTPGPNSKTPGDTAHPFYYSSPSFNLRDHSKLEEAYNDMHSSKFINLMPISVLTESLAHYFKDVRSHPPVLVTFPPPEEEMWTDESTSGTEGSTASGTQQQHSVSPTYSRRISRKSRPSTAGSSVGSSGGSPTHSFHPLSPISPLSDGRPSMSSPATADGSLFALVEDTDAAAEPVSTRFMTHPPLGGWHTLHLDVRSLVHPRQPFIMIDRCRMPARGFGVLPTALVNSTSEGSTVHRVYGPMMRVPNRTFDLDLQSLTLLLSQSVTDVLECSESIWEYLVEQGKARTKRPARPSPHSHPLSSAGIFTAASTTTSRGMVDREEFDHWISKYEKDMRARIGMAEALRRRFGWETKGLSSDYVMTNTRPYAMSTTTPTTAAPTSALSVTPPRPRLLGDPSPEDMLVGHSSSSVSLLGDDGTEQGVDTVGTMRQRTGSAPERVFPNNAHRRQQDVKHVAVAQTVVGDAGGHRRSHSLDAANASEVIGGAGEGGHGEISCEGAGELDGELPRLSRCIKVFVAWNEKS